MIKANPPAHNFSAHDEHGRPMTGCTLTLMNGLGRHQWDESGELDFYEFPAHVEKTQTHRLAERVDTCKQCGLKATVTLKLSKGFLK